MHEIRFHDMPAGGPRIAFRYSAATANHAPTLVFLPGYMSDMAGTKAGAIHDWAVRQGMGCLLLDYSGCGQSGGDFADGTLSRWRDEVLALIAAHISGPAVLVGSSMGGWLMLLVAQGLGEQVAGLVGIAAAPDFTQWGYTEAEQARLAQGGTLLADNPYGPEPTPTHAAFWADGQANLLLADEIALTCKVQLIHGLCDEDVPHDISLFLAQALRSDDVQIRFVKDGDHRLSRPSDIALMLAAVAEVAEAQTVETIGNPCR